MSHIRSVIVLLIVSGVLGALTMADVALAIVWFTPPPELMLCGADAQQIAWWVPHPRVQAATNGPYVVASTGSARGLRHRRTVCTVLVSGRVDTVGERLIVRAGWPRLAFEGGETTIKLPTGGTQREFDALIEGTRRNGEKRLWPLRPMWPGLAIDAMIFAGMWLIVVVLVSGGRNILRSCRGRCPRCGYDLRGDRQRGCSECGWRRADS